MSKSNLLCGSMCNEIVKDNSMCDLERTKLNKILNDDFEYNRLVNVFDSAHNAYGKKEEVSYLSVLNDVLLHGIDSTIIKSMEELRLYQYAINMRLI